MANKQKDVRPISIGQIVSEELMKLSRGYMQTASANLADGGGAAEHGFNRAWRDSMISSALRNQGVRSALAMTIENRVLNEVVGIK